MNLRGSGPPALGEPFTFVANPKWEIPIALIVAQTPEDNESMSISRYEVHPNLSAHAKYIITTSVSIIANRGSDWWTYSVNSMSEGTCLDLEKKLVFTTSMPFFYFEFHCQDAVATGRSYKGVTQTEALMTVPMSGLRLGVSSIQAPVGKIMMHRFENVTQMMNTDKEAAKRFAARYTCERALDIGDGGSSIVME